MKKIFLALLVALLAGVALYFSLSQSRQAPAVPELPGVASPQEPIESKPAPKVLTPLLPEVGDLGSPEVGAGADQRATVDQQPGALLPAEERCTLAVQIRLPAGAPADDGAELVVVRGSTDISDIQLELDGQADGETPPSSVLARAPVDPTGRTEFLLRRGVDSVAVVLRARYSYAEPAVAVQVSGERAEASLAARLGACIQGRLQPPGSASDERRQLAETKVHLNSDPMAGVGGSRGFDVSKIVSLESLCRTDGSFELRGVPPSKDLTLSGRPERLAAFKTPIAEVTAGQLLPLTIPLSLGATTSGRVLDDVGSAVGGAKIAVRTDAVMWGFGGRVLRETESDPDGSYRLVAVAAGKVMVDVKAEGYLDTTQDLELAEGEERPGLDLRLQSGASVAGRVLWSDGSAAPDVKVDLSFDQAHLMGMEALNAARGATGKAVTGEEGRFRISGLGKGPFSVVARHEPRDEHSDSGEWTAQVDGVKPGAIDVELTLQPSSGLSGRVVDDTGAAVAECKVVYGPKARNPWVPSTGQDTFQVKEESGAFQLEGLRAGTYTLRAEGERCVSEPVDVVLPRAEGEEVLVLTLPRPASVSGRVLLPGGAPAAGARVERQVGLAEMSRGSLPGSGDGATTAEDGSFTLHSLPMGQITLHATHADFAPSEGVGLQVEPAQEVTNVTLTLRQGGTITGELYADDGSPKAEARILAQMPDLRYGQVWARTDGAGKFDFQHVAPGQWQVMSMAFEDMGKDPADDGEDDQAAAMSKLFDQLKIAMADVKDGETVHVVLGAPPRDPVHVRGRVVAGKDPVSGAMVSFLDSSGEDTQGGLGSMKMRSSDKDGRFELDLDHPGSYLISVQNVDMQGSQQSIEFSRVIPATPEHSLELELPVGSIRGRVTGADGNPLAGARVSLNVDGPVKAATLTGGRFSEVRTDARGEYRLDWLAPGRYSVSAGGALFGAMTGEGAAPARQVRDGIEVTEGDGVVGVDFRLSAGCELTGKVLDSAGKAVAEAGIFLRDDQGRPVERITMTTTDSGGSFRQGGLGAGRYTVSARSGSLVSTGEVSVLVREGEPASVEMHMESGTILLVTVSGADGAAIEASFSVTDDKGRQVNGLYSMADLMQVFTEGGFNSKEQRVGPLAPGKYKLTAIGPDGKKVTKPVTLTGQAERRVKLELE